ncbi:MAG: hypothetical protein SXV54_17470 [Chloroflexota bacterium]|nr:hypothetical protein [Chloroflexota bacterium]
MLQEHVVVQDEPVKVVAIPERPVSGYSFIAPLTYLWYGGEVNASEILRVLDKAADDDSFIAQLTYHGSKALQGYDLTMEEKAALLSGDIGWIEARVGKLDARLRTWLDCRLEQEIW